MVEHTKAFSTLLIGVLALAGCADSREPGTNVMGNTNWLTACDEADDCGDGLSCICGVCTRECEGASDCGGLPQARCDSGSQLAPSGEATCETSSVPDVCLPPVTLGSLACGPNGVFVSINVAPDMECAYSTDGGMGIPTGQYDIRGVRRGSASCNAPYQLAMLVTSCLSGVGDSLHIHSAEIRLMDQSRTTIVFDLLEPQLPNPFLVTTNGFVGVMEGDEPSRTVAVVDTIPRVYADQLFNFVDTQILAEVKIFGTTIGDKDVELRPFVYGVRICDGCLTVCGTDIPDTTTLDEVYGDECPDNAGADGRVCVDFDETCG